MIRYLSIGVIFYMILGIIWWGMLLSKKNKEIYELKKAFILNTQELKSIENERSRQTIMILGEGFVLGCSLLLGIYIINRSANKEIQNANQQSDFLLSVSHELKSPVAAIKLALQTLVRPGLTKQKEDQIRRSALEDTKRLEKLVQNILLSASIENNGLELYKSDIDLLQLVEEIIGNYRSENANSHFKIDHPESSIQISADRQNIKQAISNIIDNAVKYSTQNTPIEILISEDVDMVHCHIRNTGTPISPGEFSRIFEKFYRSNDIEIRRKEGTGIGLYITKEIVEAHRGSIDVKSKNNQNTFSMRLPKYG